MDEFLTIGKKIWQKAESQGFTKVSFSKVLGISRQTLDNWIAGKTSPDHKDLELASKTLNSNFTTSGIEVAELNTRYESIDDLRKTIAAHEKTIATMEKMDDMKDKLLNEYREQLEQCREKLAKVKQSS